MVNQEISAYLAAIGRRGGQKSRRRLGAAEARAMVRLREARRAFREFHSSCFWSSPADFKAREEDIPWIVEQLRRNGGRAGWERAERLCR